MTSDPSLRARGWRLALGSIVIAALVLIAGYAMWSLVQLLTPLWTASRLVPVDAQIEQVEVKRRTADSYDLTLSYRYVYAGKTYRSTRLTFDPQGVDNVGSNLRDTRDRYRDAMRSQRPVTAWVDPAAPEFAVLDKGVRWPIASVLLAFVLMLLGLLAGALRRFARGLAALREDGIGPARVAPPAPLRPSNEPVAVGLAFALVSSVVLVVTWTYLPGTAVSLFAAAFALIPLAMLWNALRRRLGRARLGSATLTTDPVAPVVGRSLSTRLRWPGKRPAGACQFRLSCARVGEDGDDWHGTVLWSEEQLVDARPDPVSGGQTASVRWTIPPGLPATAAAVESDGVYRRVRWQLFVQGLDRSDTAEFDLTLGADPLAQPACAAPAPPGLAGTWAGGSSNAIPASMARVRQTAAGCAVDYPTQGLRGVALALAVVAAGAAAFAGYVLLFDPAPASTLGVAVATALAWLLGLLALHAATFWIRMAIGPDGLTIEQSSWLWHRRRRLPLAALDGVRAQRQPLVNRRGDDLSSWRVWVRTVGGGAPVYASPGLDAGPIAQAIAAALTAGLERARAALPGTAPTEDAGTWRAVLPRAALLLALSAGAAASGWTVFAWHEQRRTMVTVTTEDGRRVTGRLIEDPRRLAVLGGSAADVEAAIKAGADPNGRSPEGGTTPLMYAALAGRLEQAAALIRLGAQVNVQMPLTERGGGETALMYAANHPELAQLLLDAGADPTLGDKYGRTAMYWAARMNSPRTLALLRDRSMSIDAPARGSGGETPLMMAVWFSAPQAIEWLLEAGADPAARDARQRDLGYYASIATKPELSRRYVEQLRGQGAGGVSADGERRSAQ
jgi:hypothetical protein